MGDAQGQVGSGEWEEPPTVTLAGPSAMAAPASRASGPSAPVARGPEPSHGATERPVRTPQEALYLDEIRRTRFMARYVVVLAALVAVVIAILGGDPTAKAIHYGGLSAGIGLSVWAIRATRDPEAYSTWITTVYACGCGIAAVSSYVYWGIFSSAIVCVPMVLFLLSYAQTLAPSAAVLVLTVGGHMLLTAGVVAGYVPDRGLIQHATASKLDVIGAALVADFILVASFVTARELRRSMLDAIERLDGAVRAMAKREALLDEARQDLERALRVGGPGRYTEQQVGSFRLGMLLGRGAMGEVYEAAREDGSRAAVKLLTAGASAEASLVRRFQLEVRLAASLTSPNVVRVLEFSADSEAIPYLAMELLSGQTLAEALRERPRLPVDEVTKLAREVGRGLAAAHAAGIVHRDLKPQNLLLHHPSEGGDPLWKILDFGVSKLIGETLTMTRGAIVGTPTYMAPEQARGGSVDARADMHALGVIVYRALTGQPPFSGADVQAVLYAIDRSLPPAPSQVAPVDPAFDVVLAIALAKDPADRFGSVEEMVAALEAAAAGRVDASLRERAEALAARLPWGKRL